MREIKFRAWDKMTNKMSPEFVLFGEFTLMGAVHAWQDEEAVLAGLKWDMTDNHDSIGRLNDLEIMQYTGLRDKNGKEIYEGDIVNGAVFGTTICYGTVDFWTGGFFIHPVVSGHADSIDLYNWIHSIEVIGNIYENPELVSSSEIPTEK